MFIGRLAFPPARSMRAPTASGEIIPNSAGAARWSSVCEADRDRAPIDHVARKDVLTDVQTIGVIVDGDPQRAKIQLEMRRSGVEQRGHRESGLIPEDGERLRAGHDPDVILRALVLVVY